MPLKKKQFALSVKKGKLLFAVLLLVSIFISILPINAHKTLALTASGTGKDKIYTASPAETRQFADNQRSKITDPNLMPTEPATAGYRWQSFSEAGTGFTSQIIWKQVPSDLTPEQALARDTQATSGGQNPAATTPPGKGLILTCGINVTCYLQHFALWISVAILWLFSWLVWLAAQLLNVSLNLPRLMGGFTTAPVVTIGWPIVRDLANMFFSLVLLVIAFATILRIETYGMKQVLWRLVVAALLINFSLVIAGVIIDGSNVLTDFFVRGNFVQQNTGQTVDISAAILNGLNLQTIYDTTKSVEKSSFTPPAGTTPATPVTGDQLTGDDISFLKIFLNTILGSVFMIITSFVLFAAAILFFIRAVALWILLIFAPLAWLAMILPATRTLWNKWWQEFIKWIIFAPVYGFFIYLTVAIINKGILEQALKQGAAAYVNDGLTFSSFLGSNLSFIANYVILSIFMVAGLIFARQSGIVGANTVMNMGKSYGRMWSRWAARGAPILPERWSKQALEERAKKAEEAGKTGRATFYRRMAGITGVAEKIGAPKRFIARMASPHVWTKAWSEMQKRADESAFGKPAGSIIDMWQAIKKLSPSDFRKAISQEGMLAQLEHQRGVDRREREYAMAYKDEPQTIDAYRKATDPVDVEALARRVGAFNGWNTLAIQEGWKEFDPDALREYWKRKFGDTANGARITADLVAVALANGFYPAAGSVVWDAGLGRNRFAKDSEEHFKVYATKMGQLEPQAWARTSHPNTFVGFTVKIDPETGEKYPEYYLHKFAKKWIKEEMTQLHINQTNRFQPRTGVALTEDKILKEIHDLNETFADELNRVAVIKGQRPMPPRPEPSPMPPGPSRGPLERL